MSGDIEPGLRRRIHRFLWIVLVAAAAVRIVAVFGQGLPECFFPDEVNAVQRSLAFGVRKSLNPEWFNKPALAYYLWFVLYGGFYVVGRAVGQFGSPDEFGVWAIDHVGPFVLIGRLMATAFGILTVWLTYRLGARVRDRATGLVAALALALTIGHIESGQWVKEDVPCAFFNTAATIALVGLVDAGRTKDARRAGLLAGLGMATKYYSIALAVPAIVASYLRSPAGATGGGWKRGTRLASVFGLLFVVGFFVGSPYNILDPSFFNGQVKPRLQDVMHMFFGAIGLPQVKRTTFVGEHGGRFIDVCLASADSLWSSGGVGPVFCVLAVVGLARALLRRRRTDTFLAFAGAWQFVLISVFNRQYSEPRHLVVLYPLLAIWVAEAITLPFCAAARFRGVGRTAVAPALALLLASCLVPTCEPSVIGAIVTRTRDALSGDTRLLATRWVEENVPEGSTIIVDQEVLALRISEGRADWALDQIRGMSDQAAQAQRLKLRKRSAQVDHTRPTFDTLCMQVPWWTEYEDRIDEGRKGRDMTWPYKFVSEPPDVPPVERYARRPSGVESASPQELRTRWPASVHLVEGRPALWVAAVETTYANYKRDTKRIDFKSRAEFYDDLLAHYDYREWTAGRGVAGPTVRLFDLTQRVSGRPPRGVEMLPPR